LAHWYYWRPCAQNEPAITSHCNAKIRGELAVGSFDATDSAERAIRHLSLMFATRDESGYYGATGAEHQEYAVHILPKRSAKLRFEFYVGREWVADYRGVECVIENVVFDDGSTWARRNPMPWP